MGVARLLAKGWVVFCLFAGAHALNLQLGRGAAPLDAVQAIGVCVLLFIAMGLLFVAGFGASYSARGTPFLARMRPRHFVPSFNDTVFLAFVVLSLVYQIVVAPSGMAGSVAVAIHNATMFSVPGTDLYLVPGQAALVRALDACNLNGGRYFAGAFTWLLAIIYVASAVSRIGLTAGILRLEQSLRPSAFGPTLLAILYGIVTVAAFQLLYVGSVYPWLDCTAFIDITGAVLIGLAPLMLAYLIVAALATLRASGPEPQ
jgi:hypothetical protein